MFRGWLDFKAERKSRCRPTKSSPPSLYCLSPRAPSPKCKNNLLRVSPVQQLSASNSWVWGIRRRLHSCSFTQKGLRRQQLLCLQHGLLGSSHREFFPQQSWAVRGQEKGTQRLVWSRGWSISSNTRDATSRYYWNMFAAKMHGLKQWRSEQIFATWRVEGPMCPAFYGLLPQRECQVVVLARSKCYSESWAGSSCVPEEGTGRDARCCEGQDWKKLEDGEAAFTNLLMSSPLGNS